MIVIDPPTNPPPVRYAAPRAREWVVIASLATMAIVYLLMVIRRVTVHGFGDVQVFFRAGWAIWSGYPLYGVTDDHGWAYHYPPSFALAMGPFANPLPGHAQLAWALPYPVAIGAWYAIGLVALFAATHVWASAIERALDLRVRDGYWQPWWALRLGPVLALLPIAGDSLGRGQPTAIVVLLMAGFLALYADGRRNAAALVLSICVALKLFPIALALIPFLRRDFRTLLALAAWCLVLFFVVPALCLGPEMTVELYRSFWNERLAGILTGDLPANIVRELSPWASDMTSIGATLARLAAGEVLDKDVPLPAWAAQTQLAADFAIVIGLVIAGHGRFWRFSRLQPGDPYPILVAGAVLMAVMPAMLPTAQTHYWAQALPLVAVLAVEAWRRAGRAVVSPWLLTWSIAAWLGILATEVTLWRPLQVVGLSAPVMLVLVAAGFVVLVRAGDATLGTIDSEAGSTRSMG